MAYMQSSGAISMSEMQSRFGGTSPVSFNEYYRGGAYVKSTKGGMVREPVSGEYYDTDYDAGMYFVNVRTAAPFNTTFSWDYREGNEDESFTVTGTVSSYTVGDTTYYKGTHRSTVAGSQTFGIYKVTNTRETINTGVPSSGTIGLASWYSAEYGV